MKKMIMSIGLLLLAMTVAQAQDEITGVWLSEDENSKVEIYEQDGLYYGKVVWLASPTDKKGNPRRDKNNPDKALRSRPIMGLDMLMGLRHHGQTWEGKLYAPKRGKTVNVSIQRQGDTALLLTVSMWGFTRTQTWNRAADETAP